MINALDVKNLARDMSINMARARKSVRVSLLDKLHSEGKLSDDDYAGAIVDVALQYSDDIDNILD